MSFECHLVRFALAIASVAACGAALAETTVELYRRVVPQEATTGVVSVRESVSPQLEVPELCDDGSLDCPVTRRFARVWRLDFEVETRRSSGDEVRVEREGRGTAFLALAAEGDDEESYDEYLREMLAKLGAAAFDEPHAGWKPDRRPFDGPVAAASAEPSWTCFENGASKVITRYTRQKTVGPDGREYVSGTSTSSYGEERITGPLCSALDDLTASAYPDVIRTISTPRVLVEERLAVEVADLLPARAYPDELVALPDGAWLRTKRVPGVRRSEGRSTQGEIVESRLAVDEVEVSAKIMPAELPTAAARQTVWHSRWTLETVERRLGPMPENRLLDSWSLTVSLMPTPPASAPGADNETPAGSASADDPYPVRLDPDTLFTSVAESLDFRSEVSPEVLADAIVRKVAGLESPGWILVLCRPGADATWGLAPTTGRARLLNGADYCAAVEQQLP